MVKICTHLQTDDVGVAAEDLLHDVLFPVIPAQSPGGAVAVQLSGGVLITQDVVAHHSEQCWEGKTQGRSDLAPRLL